jgi:hypothetical protein
MARRSVKKRLGASPAWPSPKTLEDDKGIIRHRADRNDVDARVDEDRKAAVRCEFTTNTAREVRMVEIVKRRWGNS